MNEGEMNERERTDRERLMSREIDVVRERRRGREGEVGPTRCRWDPHGADGTTPMIAVREFFRAVDRSQVHG